MQTRIWSGGLLALLFTVGMVALLARPVSLHVDVGAAGDFRFGERWSVPEQGDGATFRWGSATTRLHLHGTGVRPPVLSLRLHRTPAMHVEPYELELRGGGQTYAAFALAPQPGWRTYHVLLPAEAVAGPLLQARRLDLTSTTHSPGAHDGRALGVPIDWLAARPLAVAPHGLALVLRALLLTAGLVLLAWALARLRGWLGVGWWLVWLPTGVAGLALLAAAGWQPHLLAWALPPLPWTLLLAGLVLGLSGLPPPAGRSVWDAPADSRVLTPGTLVALAGIGALALALRLWQLDALPYGLWRDEAQHGLIALRMLADPAYRPIYVATGDVNMPALGFYPFALALELGGIHTWTLRLVPALAGALTVLPLYALVAQLTRQRALGLLAAALLAVSSWHITLSRYAFPTIMEPLFALAGLALLLRALAAPPGRVPWLSGLLAGASLGLAVQMYHTGRVVPLVAALLLVLWWVAHRQQGRRVLGVALLGAAGFALTAGPLLAYALTQPAELNERVGRVFLLGNAYERGRAPLGDLDTALGAHLLMFNVAGDANGRHHAPGLPLLDILTGVGFVVGLVGLVRAWRDWRSLLLLGGLGLGVLPSLLAVDGPHAMRSVGALALACTVAALGWGRLLARLRLRGEQRAVVGAALVALALALNGWVYFGWMPQQRAVWLSAYPVHTQIGLYLRAQHTNPAAGDPPVLYVDRGLTTNAVYRYLAADLPIETFDDAQVSRPPPSGALFVLSGYRYRADVADLAAYLGDTPPPAAHGPDLPGTRAPSFVVYRVP